MAQRCDSFCGIGAESIARVKVTHWNSIEGHPQPCYARLGLAHRTRQWNIELPEKGLVAEQAFLPFHRRGKPAARIDLQVLRGLPCQSKRSRLIKHRVG